MHGYPVSIWNGRARQEGRVSYASGSPGALIPTSDLKTHLRITHSSEDSYLDTLIAAATDEIDMPRTDNAPPGWLGRTLITRKLKLTLNAVPPSVIRLPGPPVTAIDKVEYRESDDTFTEITSSDYHSDLDQEPALLWHDDEWPVWPGDWPQDIKGGPDTFRVEYTAGYADASSVPAVIKHYVLMRAAEMYRDREGTNRGTISKRFEHFDRMLDNWRVRV